MPNYHSTTIVGHCGRMPETRYLPSGDAVCNFSVAVTEKWKKEGEAKEQTTWYRVNAFGKLAETCGKYIDKGTPVMIVGRMQSREWTDKEGHKRESWELRADTMQLLGGNQDRKEPKPAKQDSGSILDLDNDVPW